MRKSKTNAQLKKEEDMRITIGKRVKILRYSQKPKLTQEDLADILDVSRSHIASLEVGKVTPSLSLLADICDYFKCSYDFLLGKVHTITSNNMTGNDNIFEIIREYKTIRFDDYEVLEKDKDKIISAIQHAISILRLNE